MAWDWVRDRHRRAGDDRIAEVTRARLQALVADLEAARSGASPAPVPRAAADAAPAAVRPVAGPVPEPRPASRRHAVDRPPLAGRVTGFLGDRVPASLQGRASLGAAQVGVVAAVLAAGLLLAAWWVVRGGAEPTAVPPPAPVVPPTVAASGSPAAPAPAPASTAEPAGTIVVDVQGKVRRPGIAVLPAGSRVVDAVEAAGGLRTGFRAATVNMARPLTDGEQVLIGGGPEPTAPAGATALPGPDPGGLVNLNTADQAALETLPGVGPVTAAAILQWRAENGAFTAVEELLEVSGIGDATLAELAPYVTV